jgi:hypothetical protein
MARFFSYSEVAEGFREMGHRFKRMAAKFAEGDEQPTAKPTEDLREILCRNGFDRTVVYDYMTDAAVGEVCRVMGFLQQENSRLGRKAASIDNTDSMKQARGYASQFSERALKRFGTSQARLVEGFLAAKGVNPDLTASEFFGPIKAPEWQSQCRRVEVQRRETGEAGHQPEGPSRGIRSGTQVEPEPDPGGLFQCLISQSTSRSTTRMASKISQSDWIGR